MNRVSRKIKMHVQCNTVQYNIPVINNTCETHTTIIMFIVVETVSEKCCFSFMINIVVFRHLNATVIINTIDCTSSFPAVNIHSERRLFFFFDLYVGVLSKSWLPMWMPIYLSTANYRKRRMKVTFSVKVLCGLEAGKEGTLCEPPHFIWKHFGNLLYSIS